MLETDDYFMPIPDPCSGPNRRRKGSIERGPPVHPEVHFIWGVAQFHHSGSELAAICVRFCGNHEFQAQVGGRAPGIDSSLNPVSIPQWGAPWGSFPHELRAGEELDRHLWGSNFNTSRPFPTEELTLATRASDIPYAPPETK